jgi:hypothetical protein
MAEMFAEKKDIKFSYVLPDQQRKPVEVSALSSGPEKRPVDQIRTVLFGYDGVGEDTLLQHLNGMKHKPDLAVVLDIGTYGYDYQECRFFKMNHEPSHKDLELACLTLMVSDWISQSTDDRILLRGHLTDYF